MHTWNRRSASLFLAFLAISPSSAALAEYSQGIGEIETATREASARLNEAFSEYHKMAAALDRKNIDDAFGRRKTAIALFVSSANAYEGAKGDGHVLNPSPRTEEEKRFVVYFSDHARNYGVQLPTTQQALIQASARIIRDLATRLDKTGIKSTAELQKFASQSAEVQQFLLSATTVLQIG